MYLEILLIHTYTPKRKWYWDLGGKVKRQFWKFQEIREGGMEKGTKGEGAPRGQDDSATGRKEAAAARRSPRPTAARWGPRAAPAAGSPRNMFSGGRGRYRFSVFILAAVFAVLGFLLCWLLLESPRCWLLFMKQVSPSNFSHQSSVHLRAGLVASHFLANQNTPSVT